MPLPEIEPTRYTEGGLHTKPKPVWLDRYQLKERLTALYETRHFKRSFVRDLRKVLEEEGIDTRVDKPALNNWLSGTSPIPKSVVQGLVKLEREKLNPTITYPFKEKEPDLEKIFEDCKRRIDETFENLFKGFKAMTLQSAQVEIEQLRMEVEKRIGTLEN